MNNKVHLGHRARKRFGQNFLHDPMVIGQIVKSINPQKGQNLVEIGPGLAALTEPVADLMDEMQVIELDRDLAERLRHHPFLAPKLTIHEGDAMKFDFRTLRNDQRKLRVFGNLPYNVSTPLMFHLFQALGDIEDMHFMLQKEVVQRLAAGPDDKNYGRLSVMAQYYCQVIPVLHVPPGAFKPAPKVDSAVVRLVPHAELPHPCLNTKVLNQVVTEAFGQRRKTIRNSFSNVLNAEEIIALGLDIKARAENLSLEDFVNAANYVAKRDGKVATE